LKDKIETYENFVKREKNTKLKAEEPNKK